MACVCVCVYVHVCACVWYVYECMSVRVCVHHRITASPGRKALEEVDRHPIPPRKRSPPSPEGVHAKQQASSFGVSDAAVGFGMASATNAPH